MDCAGPLQWPFKWNKNVMLRVPGLSRSPSREVNEGFSNLMSRLGLRARVSLGYAQILNIYSNNY